METIPEVEVVAGNGDEQEDESEVPLVRKRRVPEAARNPDLDRAQSGAAAGPSVQGEEMAERGGPDIRSMFRRGKALEGPLVKRLRLSSKKTPPLAATTSQSPTKGKSSSLGASPVTGATAIFPRPPPPPARESVASAVLALHRSISRARSKNEEIKVELAAAQATLYASEQNEQTAKSALAAAQASEREAKSALTTAQAAEQKAKVALAAAQVDEQEARATSTALQVKLEGAKAKLLEAEAVVREEKEALAFSMESMLYHCWAFNQDGNFSFMAPDAWGHYLENFKARLQSELPTGTETGETSVAGEQDAEEVTSSE
ncbi:uncharacterized protein LOC133824301 [Humulus lupulus]|uniref:uncharacterized protein LOC133824301 n=1 Tax=Humulus lupulus TaxID=3486 RepID=UPI002B40909F|nr:uncharacterized protein LOC133824301 [Humulus lupulus]